MVTNGQLAQAVSRANAERRNALWVTEGDSKDHVIDAYE